MTAEHARLPGARAGHTPRYLNISQSHRAMQLRRVPPSAPPWVGPSQTHLPADAPLPCPDTTPAHCILYPPRTRTAGNPTRPFTVPTRPEHEAPYSYVPPRKAPMAGPTSKCQTGPAPGPPLPRRQRSIASKFGRAAALLPHGHPRFPPPLAAGRKAGRNNGSRHRQGMGKMGEETSLGDRHVEREIYEAPVFPH